jgi:hypothetical protein
MADEIQQVKDAVKKALQTAFKDAWEYEWEILEDKWYTQEQWAARDEEFGHDAIATLNIEESYLYEAINYGDDNWKFQTELAAALKEIGCFFELGWKWSVHFYKS